MNKKPLFCALFFLSLGACTAAPDKPVEGQGLAPCGTFPNCVSSQSSDEGHAIAPLSATADEWEGLRQHIREQERWEIVVEENNFLQMVVISPLMRYRDDVQLLYLPDAAQIQVRSSSRLGIGDMGVNRARVEQLREALVKP